MSVFVDNYLVGNISFKKTLNMIQSILLNYWVWESLRMWYLPRDSNIPELRNMP